MVIPAVFTPAEFAAGIESAVLELRAFAESLMIDACLIEARTGRVMDPETLEYVDAYEPVYGPGIAPEHGKCRFKPTDALSNDLTEGEREFQVGRAELQLPITAPRMAEGLRVTITAAPEDPEQEGRVFVVNGTEVRTQATKRTVALNEVLDDAD